VCFNGSDGMCRVTGDRRLASAHDFWLRGRSSSCYPTHDRACIPSTWFPTFTEESIPFASAARLRPRIFLRRRVTKHPHRLEDIAGSAPPESRRARGRQASFFFSLPIKSSPAIFTADSRRVA